MKCGNCGTSNEYGAEVCTKCGSTLSLTEVFRPTGFVEKQPLHEILAKEKEAEVQKTQATKAQLRQPEPLEYEPQARQKQSPPHEPRSRQRRSSDHSNQGRKKEAPRPTEKKPQSVAPHSEARKKQLRKQEEAPTKARKQPEQPKPSAKKPIPDREDAPKKPTPQRSTSEKKLKRAPSPKAYNRTTRTLSIAEKFVKQKTQKRSWKWLIPVILILALGAGGVLLGTMQSGPKEDSYTRVAENFVKAVVMNDADAAADCIHPSMHGKLRSMNYQNVERCEAKTIRYEVLEADQMSRELQQRYGIQDPVSKLYRVHVGYTIYGERNYACTMDVLVANIGGRICAVKTENIDDTQSNAAP